MPPANQRTDAGCKSLSVDAIIAAVRLDLHPLRAYETLRAMWLPTPTAEQVKRLRNRMEPSFPVPLTDEQWTEMATKLARIFYLKYIALDRELGPERSEISAVDESGMAINLPNGSNS